MSVILVLLFVQELASYGKYFVLISGPCANISFDFDPFVDFIAQRANKFQDFRLNANFYLYKRALIRASAFPSAGVEFNMATGSSPDPGCQFPASTSPKNSEKISKIISFNEYDESEL